jgi:hypothetical protein
MLVAILIQGRGEPLQAYDGVSSQLLDLMRREVFSKSHKGVKACKSFVQVTISVIRKLSVVSPPMVVTYFVCYSCLHRERGVGVCDIGPGIDV